jgi:hypothetical protein
MTEREVKMGPSELPPRDDCLDAVRAKMEQQIFDSAFEG